MKNYHPKNLKLKDKANIKRDYFDETAKMVIYGCFVVLLATSCYFGQRQVKTGWFLWSVKTWSIKCVENRQVRHDTTDNHSWILPPFEIKSFNPIHGYGPLLTVHDRSHIDGAFKHRWHLSRNRLSFHQK